MMKPFATVCILIATSTWAADKFPKYDYPNFWVHNHFLVQPKADGLKGEYAQYTMSPEAIAMGQVTVAFPLELPATRDEILHNPLPMYSHRGSFSEWGMGWEASYSIQRYSEIGEVDCQGNLFSSPWGPLRLSSQQNVFYPKGLHLDLQVVKTAEGFTAHHPAGRTYFFSESFGNYTWYLTEVKDRTGLVTTYFYEKNRLGRPILKSVQYGGKKHRQYEIEFVYEDVKSPVRTFHNCGAETTLDQMVKQVVIKHWDGNRFKTSRKALLSYQGRYLSQVDIEFASGDRLPPIRYEYDQFKPYVKWEQPDSSVSWLGLVAGLNNHRLYTTSVAYVDFNQDGRVDIERADNLKSYVQQPEGKFTFFQESNFEQFDPRCKMGDFQTRRLLFRPSGLNDELHQLILINDQHFAGTVTQIFVCSLHGKLSYEKHITNLLESEFVFRNNTHLVDLNGDAKADIIRVANDEVAFFMNESTQTEIKFADMVKKPLPGMYDLKVKRIFFADMNADRIVDVIAQTPYGLAVWYGKGDASFEAEFAVLPFKLESNPNWNLVEAELEFIDVNRDGLADVFFKIGLRFDFFINRGNHFFVSYLPPHNIDPSFIEYPRIMNVNGTADDQLMWGGLYGILSYELNSASTGLLTRVDNGQGVLLDFEYQWTELKPGIPKPFIIPKSMIVTTAGKGAEKTEFEFIDPKVDLYLGGRLLGFGQVNTKTSQVTTLTRYLTTLEHAPMAVDVSRQDERIHDLADILHYDRELAELDGIPYLKLLRTVQAYATGTETLLRRSVSYLNHDRLCVNKTSETTSAGILDRLISYFDSRACLKSNDTLAGQDFSYTTLTDYNQAGLPTQVSLAAASERLPKAMLGYDEANNLVNVTEPKTGTVLLQYDPVFEVLKSLNYPDGTWREMTGFSSESDALSSLLLKTTGIEALHQRFEYDDFHRPKEVSNDLGESFRYVYRLSNRTVPGIVLETQSQTVILTNSAGEMLTQAKYSATGWSYERLNRWQQGKSITQQVDLSDFHQAPEEYKYRDFRKLAKTVVDETELSELGGVLSKWSFVDASQKNLILRNVYADSAGFHAKSRENHQYVTEAATDLSDGLPISYTDELGKLYTYNRDVLGRLRQISLPDGHTHTVDFDEFGRVSLITRSGVGNVSYLYENTRDRLSEKCVLGVCESYEYDSAGRVHAKNHQQNRYEFSYEGSSVTEVRHSDFTKAFAYEADEKPRLKAVKTSGPSIEVNYQYGRWRNLLQESVSGIYAKQFEYDDYRQLGLVRIGNQTFSIIRNQFGKITQIGLPNDQVFDVEYDSLTHAPRAYQSPLGSYEWRLNDRGLIEQTRFSSGSDTCNSQNFEFVYAADKALVENRHPGLDPGSRNGAAVERGIYDENHHLIGKKSTNGIDYIRLDNFVVTKDHVYEKFSIEGVDLGILIDGQFQPCLFDQVGTLLAVGDFVSIPSAFGVRNETLPILEYFDYAGHGRDPETGLIAMGERLYDPQTQRFTTPDKYFLEHPEECIRSSQECDLYSYARKNPLQYKDSSGQFADITLDLGFVAWSAYELFKDPSVVNAVALGLDVAGAALPFVTGLGRAYKAASTAEDVGKAIERVANSIERPASSAVNAQKLKEQLRWEEARSLFTKEGHLSKDLIDRSKEIFKPGTLRNPAVPEGFGKFTTKELRSPSGPFEVHFYKNPKTGDVFYDLDYKAVSNLGFQGVKK